jgi:hypothetical protein
MQAIIELAKLYIPEADRPVPLQPLFCGNRYGTRPGQKCGGGRKAEPSPPTIFFPSRTDLVNHAVLESRRNRNEPLLLRHPLWRYGSQSSDFVAQILGNTSDDPRLAEALLSSRDSRTPLELSAFRRHPCRPTPGLSPSLPTAGARAKQNGWSEVVSGRSRLVRNPCANVQNANG